MLPERFLDFFLNVYKEKRGIVTGRSQKIRSVKEI